MSSPQTPIRLTVYSGAECCLCDEAKVQLEPLASELGLDVEWVTIDGETSLETLWRERIPAGVIRDRLVFKYRVDEQLLRRRVAELRPS